MMKVERKLNTQMEKIEPENTARMVVDACSDCDVCRFLMDSDCLMFPELYRLYDKEIETGKKIRSDELRKLVDLCNFCALCPCPNIRADIIKAKTQFIERDGLKFGVRTLEDVERVGRRAHPGGCRTRRKAVRNVSPADQFSFPT
jgi:glycerol-3-phosphate dehydrogenase subunit C